MSQGYTNVRGTGLAESSIVEFEERLIIHVPANVVERMLVDAPALPQWRTCMRENVETSDPIMKPGTTVSFATTQYGLNFDYIQIVSQYIPGETLAYRTTKGLFFIDTTYEWAEDHGSTRLTCRYRLYVPKNKQFIKRLVERSFQNQSRDDNKNLKHLLETGAQRYRVASNLTPDEPRLESLK